MEGEEPKGRDPLRARAQAGHGTSVAVDQSSSTLLLGLVSRGAPASRRSETHASTLPPGGCALREQANASRKRVAKAHSLRCAELAPQPPKLSALCGMSLLMPLPRILCNDANAPDIVHITTATYPITADTLCGQKHMPAVGFWTEGHPDLMPFAFATCAKCRAFVLSGPHA